MSLKAAFVIRRLGRLVLGGMLMRGPGTPFAAAGSASPGCCVSEVENVAVWVCFPGVGGAGTVGDRW